MNEQQTLPVFEKSEEQFNLKDLLFRYLRNWKWMALSAFVFCFIALIYLNASTSLYKSTSKVLIKEEKKGGMDATMDIFEDLGLSSGSANLENEIQLFKSLTLLKKVVSELKLNIDVALKDDESEIYFQQSPISVQSAVNDSVFSNKNANFELEIESATTFSLKDEKSGRNLGVFTFGKAFNSPIGKLIITKTAFYKTENDEEIYTINVSPIQTVAGELQKKLNIGTINDEATVLSISLEGPNIEKNNAIINAVIRLHEQSAIEDKNEITKTTSEFINERMAVITQELSLVEVEGQKYKTDKSLTDLTSDAQLFIEKNSQLEDQITQASIQFELAEYMNTYLAKQTGYNVLLPSNLGFEDASVAAMISQYNTNVLERNRLLQSSNESNPVVRKMEGQLDGIKNSLVASLNNMRSSLQIKLNKLESDERQNQSKIAAIPEYEREFRSIARQQQIKETLYLYLLQKREENEIAMAATIGNVKLIDEPYSDGIPVSPKKKIFLLGAFLIGLLLPIGVIYVKDLLDNKVRSINDIEKLNLPFAGDIPFDGSKNTLVVNRGERSPISEAFRILRTNMSFMLHAKNSDGQIILVTSSIKGEGKSFTAINLAHSLSLTDKKVLLIGMDLRSPKLSKYLELPETVGVTNFIVDHTLDLDKIIQSSPSDPNLHFLASGPIPPNPSELLLSEQITKLMAYARKEYDYVIIDSAPVGLVVDTQIIAPHADLTLYVVRANYADKRLMTIPQNMYRDKKIKNIGIVLNGIEEKNTRNYYGYGYGYGYGDEIQTKKSFIKRVFKF